MKNSNELNYEKIQKAINTLYDFFEVFSSLSQAELQFIKLAQEQVRAKDKLEKFLKQIEEENKKNDK